MTATLAEKLAFQLFHSLDLRVDAASVEKSLLSLAKAHVGDQTTTFTEKYFYEEAIFYAFLLIEAEDRFAYVTRTIRLYEQERNGGMCLEISSRDVCLQLIRDYYGLAVERMILCGMSPSMISEDAVVEYIEQRRSAYVPLIKHALSNGPDALQMSPLSTILTPDDTPLKSYLSHVVSRLASALACQNDPILRSGLELAVTQIWLMAFSIAETTALRR